MSKLSGIIHSIGSLTNINDLGLRLVINLQGSFKKYCVFENPDMVELCRTGKRISVNNILKQMENDYEYLKPNRGGLTVSGGDPLVQGHFVSDLFKNTQEIGLTTYLDTSGMGYIQHYKDVLKYTNFTRLCVKSLNPLQHIIISGVDICHLNKFVKELDNYNKDFIVRQILVTNGRYQTNDDDNISRLVDFINSRKHCRGIEIMPFQNLEQYKLNNIIIPSTEEELQQFVDKIKNKLCNDKKIIV